MEKISRVLPPSPRVKSVDLEAAHPVRPGTPTFGIPVGSTSSDRLTLSNEAKARAFQETLAARNPRQANHAKIAENVTREFFETRLYKEPARGEAEVLQPTVAYEPAVKPAVASSIEEALPGEVLDVQA